MAKAVGSNLRDNIDGLTGSFIERERERERERGERERERERKRVFGIYSAIYTKGKFADMHLYVCPL